jgi:hypothetical protein
VVDLVMALVEVVVALVVVMVLVANEQYIS